MNVACAILGLWCSIVGPYPLDYANFKIPAGKSFTLVNPDFSFCVTNVSDHDAVLHVEYVTGSFAPGHRWGHIALDPGLEECHDQCKPDDKDKCAPVS